MPNKKYHEGYQIVEEVSDLSILVDSNGLAFQLRFDPSPELIPAAGDEYSIDLAVPEEDIDYPDFPFTLIIDGNSLVDILNEED